MSQAHVQVVLEQTTIPPNLEAALRRTNASVSFRPLSEALRPGSTVGADAVVVVADSVNIGPTPDHMKLLLDRLADNPCATLVLNDGCANRTRFSHPSDLPLTFADGAGEDELTFRLQTMLDMRRSFDSLNRGIAKHEAEQNTVTRRYNDQLKLASKVQREFLPDRLPRFGPISFSVIYRPAEYVSGDIYDVQRLDEDHVGITIADATGHGIPAALLTVFIKRALRGKDIFNGHYRVLAPDEVLRRLNDEILDANLSECRFVAATYCVLNLRTYELVVARGGAPYPIIRRANGSTSLIRAGGGVVGVIPEATFGVESVQLARGDAVIFFSDGMENLVLPEIASRTMADAFTRAASYIPSDGRHADDDCLPHVHTSRCAGAIPSRCAVGASSLCDPQTACHADPKVGMPDRSPFINHGATPMSAAPDAPRAQPTHKSAQRRQAAPTDQTYSSQPHPDPSIAGGLTLQTTPSPDELIIASGWFATLQKRGVAAACDEANARYDALRRIGHALDDLTVLSLQIDP